MAHPQIVYLGLDLDTTQDPPKYAISVHDGTITTHFDINTLSPQTKKDPREAYNAFQKVVIDYVRDNNYKVHIVACPDTSRSEAHDMVTYFWQELDALPVFAHVRGSSVDECASAAIRKAVVR